jgi:hypothetical protein
VKLVRRICPSSSAAAHPKQPGVEPDPGGQVPDTSSFQVQAPSSFTTSAPKLSPGRDSDTVAPPGSRTVATRPPPGASNGATSTSPPSSRARPVARSTSPTLTYDPHTGVSAWSYSPATAFPRSRQIEYVPLSPVGRSSNSHPSSPRRTPWPPARRWSQVDPAEGAVRVLLDLAHVPPSIEPVPVDTNRTPMTRSGVASNTCLERHAPSMAAASHSWRRAIALRTTGSRENGSPVSPLVQQAVGALATRPNGMKTGQSPNADLSKERLV